MKKIFIDGKEGTTGLKIFERFQSRSDLELIQIEEELRKEKSAREKCINCADYVFLCLPDEAAKEAVALCKSPETKIIDASTAHRTNAAWAYGFPELGADFRKKIALSKRVAVPGCYASGFNALVFPLVKRGIISPDYPVTCHAVSGYSGGGKKAISQYENPARNSELRSPRQYALSQNHKHLAEMKAVSRLSFEPIFNPYICDFFCGMSVTVPIFSRLLLKKISAEKICEELVAHYEGCRFVKVMPFMGSGVLSEPFIAANNLSGTNEMQIFVYGNDERICLCARFDNLGKGASGAAVQCMNIMMGIDEGVGL